mmetsp:Transcript_25643/g.51030  ORF Transcript_25643/g.51030 Transcript_25643/m.51030 type:complete len:97 (+) Transcript_25643:183-473(+)
MVINTAYTNNMNQQLRVGKLWHVQNYYIASPNTCEFLLSHSNNPQGQIIHEKILVPAPLMSATISTHSTAINAIITNSLRLLFCAAFTSKKNFALF